MLIVLAVGLGGMFGSMMRYLASSWIQKLSHSTVFPFGTMAVNIIGCLIIGLLGGFFEAKEAFSPALRAFLMVGILGGFTTFSSFEYETLHLLRNSEIFYAALNVTVQLISGLIFVFLGYYISTNVR
jgi:CrcB protein